MASLQDLSKQMPFSRAWGVATRGPPLVHQLSIALTDDSCMCQTKTNSAIVLGCIKKQIYIKRKKMKISFFNLH